MATTRKLSKVRPGEGITHQVVSILFSSAVIPSLVAFSVWSFNQTELFFRIFGSNEVFGIKLSILAAVIFQYGQTGFWFAAREQKLQADKYQGRKSARGIEVYERAKLLAKVYSSFFFVTLSVDIMSNIVQFMIEFSPDKYLATVGVVDGFGKTVILIIAWLIGFLLVISMAWFEELVPVFVVFWFTSLNDILEFFGRGRIEAFDSSMDDETSLGGSGGFPRPQPAARTVTRRSPASEPSFRPVPKRSVRADSDDAFEPTYHNLGS